MMKTFERIPERVRAFQITQGMIDGSEALPEGFKIGTDTHGATHFIVGPGWGVGAEGKQIKSSLRTGQWIVFLGGGAWARMFEGEFRAKYRATSDSESESTDE